MTFSVAAMLMLVVGVLDADYGLTMLNTREVIGFEYYTPANTPLKYNRTSMGRGASPVCGTVLRWLR